MNAEILNEPLTNRTLFISIDGLSGSGKTTMTFHLANKFGGLYMKSPPRPLDIIRTEVDNAMDPTARVLYYLSGIVQQGKDIEQELLHRSVVIDKYIYTTLAYARSIDIPAVVPPFIKLLKPDFSFYMVTSDELRMQRIKARDGNLSYRGSHMLQYEQQVHHEFSKLPLVHINNDGDMDTVLNNICHIIQQHSEEISDRQYFDLDVLNTM